MKDPVYTIEHKRKTIHVKMPYVKDVVYNFRKLGGTWKREYMAWVFAKEKEKIIREVLFLTFGHALVCKLKITIKKHKILDELEICDKKIIKLDYFNNFYEMQWGITVIKGSLTTETWRRCDGYSFRREIFQCYFVQKVIKFLNPFIIRDITFTIDDLEEIKVDKLVLNPPKWVDEITKISY